MKSIIIDTDAQGDIRQPSEWYDAQRAGLSAEFIAELDRLLERVIQLPESFPIVTRRARRGILKRFPYSSCF